jgi:NTE family protein
LVAKGRLGLAIRRKGRRRRGAALGLALGSGGARGAAHTGVLKVLEREGIAVQCISGSSIGAVVGGAHAAGISPTDVEREWLSADLVKVVRAFFPTLTRSGISSGSEKRRILSGILGDLRIEDLPIAFAAVACDMDFGESVAISEGSLVDAVQASASIPGLFRPVRLGERTLVDGGLVDPLPVAACRDLGAEIVLAVDIHPLPCGGETAGAESPFDRLGRRLRATFRQHRWLPGTLSELLGQELESTSERPRPLPAVGGVLNRSVVILQHRILTLEMERNPPDLVIRPEIPYSQFGYLRAADGIRAGEEAAEAMLPKIRRLLK